MRRTDRDVADLVVAFLKPTWTYYSVHAIAKHLGISRAVVRRAIEGDDRFQSRRETHAGWDIYRYQLCDWRTA